MRKPAPAGDYDVARTSHSNELQNLCVSYDLPWPLPIGDDGLIGAKDFQALQDKLNSYPDHDYAKRDRARFVELFKLCNYI